MQIAIIGAGNVGGGLATALAAVGHDVVFGVRDTQTEKTRAALAAAPGATAADPASAVDGAVATPRPSRRWSGVAALSQRHGRTVGFALRTGDATGRNSPKPEDPTAVERRHPGSFRDLRNSRKIW
jgi:glycine/D-amino acid oxidase-like deaminating enzyme